MLYGFDKGWSCDHFGDPLGRECAKVVVAEFRIDAGLSEQASFGVTDVEFQGHGDLPLFGIGPGQATRMRSRASVPRLRDGASMLGSRDGGVGANSAGRPAASIRHHGQSLAAAV